MESRPGAYHLGRVIALLELVGGNETAEFAKMAKVCPSAWLPKMRQVASRVLEKWRIGNRSLFDYYDRLLPEAWLGIEAIPEIVTAPDDCQILLGYQKQRYSVLSQIAG